MTSHIRGPTMGATFPCNGKSFENPVRRASERTFTPMIYAHPLLPACRGGVDLHTARELAGHKSLTVTEGYSHQAPSRLKSFVDNLLQAMPRPASGSAAAPTCPVDAESTGGKGTDLAPSKGRGNSKWNGLVVAAALMTVEAPCRHCPTTTAH